MLDLKEWILSNLITKNNCFKNRSTNMEWIKAKPNGIRFLEELYVKTNYVKTDNILERFYHIINDMSSIPKCPYCNQDLHLSRTKGILSYTKYCKNNICKKQHIRICNIGKKQSNNTCQKRSDSLKNRIFSNITKQKISEGLKKYHLTDKGKQDHLKRVCDFNTRQKQSNTIKEKIKNGQFIPNITNSWTNCHKIQINNQKYRSTWEAVFHIINHQCEYEKIKIQYILPSNNSQHTYIVDFVDFNSKILYEIKPISNLTNEQTIAKIQAAEEWCQKNEFTFKLITNEWFKENANKIDYNKYDDNIKRGMKKFL